MYVAFSRDESTMGFAFPKEERDGLVAKLNEARDKRETRVTVTAKGRSLFAESLGSVLDYYGRFLSGVSQEERSVFMAVLKRIERNVCRPSAELIDR